MSESEAGWVTAGWAVAEEAAAEKVADSARSLITSLRRADAPVETLDRAAALVAEAAALLAEHRVDGMPMQGRIGPDGPSGTDHAKDPKRFFPFSPVIGPLNPIAPPIDFGFDGERMHATANLGAQYNGPPGMVHGGIIALVFDELLGATNVCHGLGGFTGTLSIRYERPTPIETDLVLEAWIDRTEGRKVFTVGTITFNGEVTARAEGIFIQSTNFKRQ
ncbi:PaaI_thioesterase domain containing protein [Acidimicrobiia bacterium]